MVGHRFSKWYSQWLLTRDRHWPSNFPQFIERRNAFTLAASRVVTVLFFDRKCEQLTTGNFSRTHTRNRKTQKYVSYHTKAAGLACSVFFTSRHHAAVDLWKWTPNCWVQISRCVCWPAAVLCRTGTAVMSARAVGKQITAWAIKGFGHQIYPRHPITALRPPVWKECVISGYITWFCGLNVICQQPSMNQILILSLMIILNLSNQGGSLWMLAFTVNEVFPPVTDEFNCLDPFSSSWVIDCYFFCSEISYMGHFFVAHC